MNESQFYHGGASNPSQNGSSSSGKRGSGRLVEEGVVISSCTSPCGACKFLRRKCINGCIFAPYFGNDQGAAKFAAVHKVFGASNVSKLLLHIPVSRRQDAVVTICYEAQARLSDPVYGCVSTILALEQQVSSLQAELETVQTQLINNRIAIANAFQASQTLSQHQNIAALQPTYSNTSSVSNNHLVNFDPISVPNSTAREEDEEDSHIPIAFTTQIID